MDSTIKKLQKHWFAICCSLYVPLMAALLFVGYNFLFRTGITYGGADSNAKLSLFGSGVISLFTLGAAILAFFGVSRGVSTQRQALQTEIATRIVSERNERERNLRERFGVTLELLSHERFGIVNGSLYAAVSLGEDWFRFGSDYNQEARARTEVQIIANLMSSTLREYSRNNAPSNFDSRIRVTFCEIVRSFYSAKNSPWETVRWDLSDSNLEGMDLRKVRMSNSNFRGCNLNGAKLQGAILKDCNFISASFVEANFGGANVADSNFEAAYLRKANFCNTHIARINLYDANLSDAIFKDPNKANSVATGWKQQQFARTVSNERTVFPMEDS